MHFGDASHALEHVARLSTWPGELSKYPAGSEHDFPNSVWIVNVVVLLSTRLIESAFGAAFLVYLHSVLKMLHQPPWRKKVKLLHNDDSWHLRKH